ncbi:TPA: riboflavin biosynthesis protein RibD [Candidatus Gastranaerophilales bacterium HUM_6]|nr:riboflavin biosynthesis protein RibD [Fusobacterium sp. CAG:815]DAA90125.1 MAG TPA: riboflavin biosynthesis protein RibD [Candidatus Gastranaerophilales bacterium HUM_7]DAA93029.1 MAG TPA: riboflavin biosynthesis protein RibD [Candidatus Gastranaerophilales bacterium HUM_6]DAB03761.1 MAG TPA: riboflavin biosynthesis protein RibD [Candidatus Gastranaerophilales bacterium HUM_12]DAB04983.1 MAG TPA: riboflavin biosynthesis protein RibD [Candidatus Gastranaerophilales bacterium HUM_14]
MKQYDLLMKKCIELAKQAQGETSPNPLVGCIVLNDIGEIISTGYHKKYGENHAERDALLKLDDAKNCTLIVNLEPCSHYGKTPPCADLIIEKGVKRVIYGMKDVNPIVAGNGLKKLIDAGIEVIGPILEDECRKLNEIFIKNQVKHKTFVALKTATTIDGKIATSTNDSKWITSDLAREEVRNIRKRYDAILTSSSTILADNPTMEHKCKVILDRKLKTNSQMTIYKQGKIFVFHSLKNQSSLSNNNLQYIYTPIVNNKLDIEFILEELYKRGIMSVLIEAGGKLNGSFLPYIDRLYHFVAPKILGDNNGKSCFYGKEVEKISNCTNLNFESVELFPPDILVNYVK